MKSQMKSGVKLNRPATPVALESLESRTLFSTAVRLPFPFPPSAPAPSAPRTSPAAHAPHHVAVRGKLTGKPETGSAAAGHTLVVEIQGTLTGFGAVTGTLTLDYGATRKGATGTLDLTGPEVNPVTGRSTFDLNLSGNLKTNKKGGAHGKLAAVTPVAFAGTTGYGALSIRFNTTTGIVGSLSERLTVPAKTTGPIPV